MSMQMQTLADDLGVELFRRRGHRVELTEGGRLLYDKAQDILGSGEDGASWRGCSSSYGQAAVGAMLSGDYILPPDYVNFRLHPDISAHTVAPAGRLSGS